MGVHSSRSIFKLNVFCGVFRAQYIDVFLQGPL